MQKECKMGNVTHKYVKLALVAFSLEDDVIHDVKADTTSQCITVASV